MANSLASAIFTYARNLLKVEGDSTDLPALQNTTFLAALNAANAEWLRSFRRGAGEPPPVRAAETAFDLVSGTDLDGAVATTDTTISVTSASDLDSSGAIVVYDDGMPDIIEYTGKSSNSLTGVSGIGWAHEDQDTVYKLYALPGNFHSFRSSPYVPDGVQINNIAYHFVPDDPQGGDFALYDNGTSKYLWLSRGAISGSCRVLYNKSGTTIDGTTDTVDVPAEYEWFLVYRLVEFGLRARGDDANAIVTARQQADAILREAHAEKNTSKIARTRPINWRRGFSLDEYYSLVTRDS
ncbi:MAG: hypothetical protein [Siphoviridae sp. ctpQM7]|nr:MAG: hypothetical protein [Siphoviridae sp. ctpQM7]